jgi:VCBS repeat protein
MGMRTISLCSVLLATARALTACAPCEKSIALYFPNEEARKATQRIRVEAHNPDTGGASTGARDCGDFLGLAKQGKPPLGSPIPGEFPFPFTQNEELNKVPVGKQIIYVLAFASSDEMAPAILEGCTDKFDSKGGKEQCQDVAVDLKVVLPDNARLVKVAGDRQVGRPGEHLAVPLRVRVDAESPASNGTYSIPGVPVTFTTQDPEFSIVDATGTDLPTVTDEKGEAKADVKLPPTAKTGDITARAMDLDDSAHPDRGQQTFSLSVTEEVNFPSQSVIGGSDIPIGVGLGHVTGGIGPDLVVLSCIGNVQTCVPGANASTPYGKTKLAVYANLASQPSQVSVTALPEGYGILPAGLAVADFVPPLGRDDIAVLNSRRADCQSRRCERGKECACYGKPEGTPCACEGAEVELFSEMNGSIVFKERATLTASNAVGMIAIRSMGGRYLDLAIASQGRTTNFRPCSLVNRCLPYESRDCRMDPERCSCTAVNDCEPNGQYCLNGPNCDCHALTGGGALDAGADPCAERENPRGFGCPPGERCECPGCSATEDNGVCIARDKIVDLLANRWNGSGGGPQPCGPGVTLGSCPAGQLCLSGRCVDRSFYNRGGCNNPLVSCDNANARNDKSCKCLDDYNGNTCNGMDGCGCSIPDRIFIGDIDAPTLPYSVAGGALRTQEDWDLIVPAISGMELIEAQPVQRTFRWKGEPIVNAPITQAIVVSLDSKIDDAQDVVWVAGAACLTGSNFERACPTFRDPPMGTEARGCIGVYYTDKQASVFELRTPVTGGCRRYFLPFAPDGICPGHFNGDPYIDIAISSRESNKLQVLNGDGRGGLLDPPKEFPLPGAGTGGPVACGDVDGDGKDDVVVVNARTGEVYVLRTGA